jgi:ABC-2 type transport system permease protein
VRLALLHARAATIELLRLPAYIVPTIAFPTMFFAFFAAPNAGADATVVMALFAGFAVLGVAFFQFGVGIATERVSPWEVYLRTLPVSPWTRFGSRVLSALLFGSASALVVIVTAVAITPAGLGMIAWVELTAVLLLGAAPFALLGIALGYLASPRAALPLANVAYLSLAFAGGLWTRPSGLPDLVAAVSPYLPTRALADSLAGIVYAHPVQWHAWLVLGAYSLAFAAVAVWGYRRDEGQRFR